MRRNLLELAIAAAIVLLLAYLLAPVTSGNCHFFSPDTLESQYQEEGLLFATAIPIYKSRSKPKESKLVNYLIAKGYWSPSTTPNPRWIRTACFSKQWRDGHSDLHRQLYWRGDDWIKWSEENPQSAASLWPRVLERLRKIDPAEVSAVSWLLWNAKVAGVIEESD